MPDDKNKASVKHAIIDKTNSRIIVYVSMATFVVIFCAFAARALISQSLYQQRVIGEKRDALKVAKANRAAVEELETTYDSFNDEVINVLGGSPTGDGPLDGTNTKIVLDALPSEYDYPALSSSIEKILIDNSYNIDSVGGSEDPALATSPEDAGSEPEPVEIPYPFSVSADVVGIQQLLDILERSIRPFQVTSLELSGSSSSLSADINMKTYYAPTTGFSVGSKVVR